ncbi:integumentary mucin C.1 [Protobothrops mucrosquamatus]|uniref:integumentary mucin C.1 n=1 Tax=Protobothrops mucrosquamatus TaxID=103944 RepID=UPI000775BCD1|nr:integumentary mucin C.1 [Protobothrops mucrosquamatus]
MEFKTCLVLATALCLGFVGPQKSSHPPYACQCLMEVSERDECEFSSENITAEQCTANGCCFDASMIDVPWCFKPSGERASVTYARKMIPPEERKDCGYQGITRKRCKRIGCCFDLKASGAPTCFHPPVNDASQHCVMEGSARLECGYPSITAEECQAKGCCFNSYDINTRWCFHPLSDTVPARLCGMAPKRRVSCGAPGISADECMAKGCCYEHYQYAKTVPWCFQPYEKQGNYYMFNLLDNLISAIAKLYWFDSHSSVRQESLTPGQRTIATPWSVGNQAEQEAEIIWHTLVTWDNHEFCLLTAKCRCDVDPHKRSNCGPPGITPQECENKGCCFNSTVPGVPWCFKPTKSKCRCDVDPHKRSNCGPPGITPQECENKGCCFNSTVPGVPWCFKPTKSKCRCNVDPRKRCNCGPPGITPQECENKGCCFNSTVPGVPWCFKPTPPKYRKVCPTDVKLRKNCGYPGIPADKCAKRKCCFDSKPPGVPWCFFNIIVEEEC